MLQVASKLLQMLKWIAKKSYDIYKTRKAEEIFGSSIKPDGTVDYGKMMVEGQKAGIGFSTLKQVIDTQSAMLNNELNLANTKQALEFAGVDRSAYDPNSTKRMGTTTAEPDTTGQTMGTIQAPPSPVQAQTMGGMETTQAPQAPQTGDMGNVDGAVVVKAPIYTPTGKISDYEQDPFANVNTGDKQPEQRNYWNDLYNYKAKSMFAGAQGGVDEAGNEIPPYKITSDDVKLTQAYAKQYGISPVDGKKMKSPQEILRERVAQIAGAVAPVPPPMLPIDPNKRVDVINAYRAKVAERQSALKDAENKVAKEFADFGVTKFGQGMETEKLDMAKKTQDFALSEIDPATNPNIWKKVNNESLQKIYTMKQGYRDLITAEKNYEADKSLGSLVSVITARLKANNQPITMDGIESGILETGAVPKESELKFKKALKDMSVLELLGAKSLSFVDLGITEQPIRKGLIETYKKNIEEDIYDRGGIPYEGYNPNAKTPPKTTKNAGTPRALPIKPPVKSPKNPKNTRGTVD